MEYDPATDGLNGYNTGSLLAYALIAGALTIFVVYTIIGWRKSKIIAKIAAILVILILLLGALPANPVGSSIGIAVGTMIAIIKKKRAAKKHSTE